MHSYFAAFSLGVIILYCTGYLLPWHDQISLLVLLIVLVLIVVIRVRLVVVLLCCCLGLLWANYVAQINQTKRLTPELVGKTLTLTGYACSLPRKQRYFFSIDFCVLSVAEPHGKHLDWQPSKVRLSAKIDYLKQFSRSAQIARLKLKAPRASLNFVGSSLEQYYFAQGLAARAWLKDAQSLAQAQLSAEQITIFQRVHWLFVRWRWSVYDYLQAATKGLEHGGVISALALGHRGDITKVDNQVLEATGLQHLMAISGLHVGIVFAFLWYLCRKRTFWIALLGLAYVFAVGFAASAQRAWLMGLLVLLVAKGWLRASWWGAYLAALALVLLLDPLAPLSLGFWYSFLAVALVLFCAQSQNFRQRSPLASLCILQLGFFILLAPVNAAFGLPHSSAMLLANLFAIPLVSVLILPLILLALVAQFISPELASMLLVLANELIHYLFNWCQSFAADLPQARTTGFESVFDVLMWGLFVLVALGAMLLSWRRAYAGCLCLLLCGYLLWPRGEPEVHPRVQLIDAGQGLALAAYRAALGHVASLVYDLGPAFGAYSVAERAVLPLLRRELFPLQVDTLILSHADADHVGAAKRFISATAPTRVLSGEPERLARVADFDAAQKVAACRAGQSYQSADFSWQVLYPPEGFEQVRRWSSNNHSCVLMLTMKGTSFLFMGDLEGFGERYFLRTYPGSLKADVLVAGHHGSAYATSMALLERVQPSYIVVSAGFQNRFGHPHPKVLARAEAQGAQVLNTAKLGGIEFSWQQGRLVWRSARQVRAAFWLWPNADSVAKRRADNKP